MRARLSRPTRPAALAAAALLLLLAGAAATPAHAGWWDDAARARETTLADLRRAPDRFRDVTVSLVVRFARKVEGPRATDAFPASEWRAFAAATPPAVAPAASAAPAPPCERFFVRVGSAEEGRLAELREGDEIRVRAVVRDAAGAEPSLEVVWISGPSDALSPEELATLKRAEDLVARENPGAAETLYRDLLEGRELAPALRADLWRRIARARRAGNRVHDAADALREALRFEPEDRWTAAELARTEALLEKIGPRRAADVPVPSATVRLAPLRDRDAPAEAAPQATAPVTPPSAPSPPKAPASATAPGATAAAPAPAVPSPAAAPAAAAPATDSVPADAPPPPPPGPRLAAPK